MTSRLDGIEGVGGSMIEHSGDKGKRFWSKVNKTDDCWLWTAAVSNPKIPEQIDESRAYGIFWDGKRLVSAHRFMYELKRRTLRPGEIVMHLCDVPRCVNPEHLQAGSQSDNLRQAVERGRHRTNPCYGSRHSGSKLTEKKVECIKQMAADGLTHRVIAKHFGVAYSLITRIVSGKIWRHTW